MIQGASGPPIIEAKGPITGPEQNFAPDLRSIVTRYVPLPPYRVLGTGTGLAFVVRGTYRYSASFVQYAVPT
jgi:hypothetical protein